MSGVDGRLVRAFWAADRALGGQRPPGKTQRWFAARHPVRLALTTSICWAAFFLLFSDDVQLADLVIGLPAGIVASAIIGLMAHYEKLRQQRLRRLGLWDGT
jgi:xanthine/uracil permease